MIAAMSTTRPEVSTRARALDAGSPLMIRDLPGGEGPRERLAIVGLPTSVTPSC